MDACGFWMQHDLLRDLAQLMDTPTCGGGLCSPTTSAHSTCDQSRDFTPHILFDGLTAIDPLDMMRSDAHEEFLNNGVDVELDEVDMYQSRLRERSTAETLICEQNPVLREYLKMKERRKKQEV